MKKGIIIAAVVLAAAALLYIFVFSKNLSGRIVMPYIAHQKPRIDPHIPSSVPLADKLDEVVFDGLFNVSANKSGIVYEDGLGEFMGMDKNNAVSVRLKPKKRWHKSFKVTMDKDKIAVNQKDNIYFMAKDLKFTLRRIQKLGSLSPDYILVSQAVKDFNFAGPDENGEIIFQFKGDRIWSENDVKEVLSFKIIPAESEMDAAEYTIGTGPYLKAGEYKENIYFTKMPEAGATIPYVILRPFIDNSTYTTELKNRNINSLLSTPFGSISPILTDPKAYFYKSSIATCFFALLYNVERLTLEQRSELRKLVSNKKIVERFFRIGTEQQRNIANYRGAGNNYAEYLNYSIFPSSSYYVEEKIVTPMHIASDERPNLSVLPDTVVIKTCVNYDLREELSELVDILNDPAISGGKIKALAVQNEELRSGNYDAILVPVTGYRSNFLFDLYEVLLREPDFNVHRISLVTGTDASGATVIDDRSFSADRNFSRIDLEVSPEKENFKKLLEYIYGFMSTSEIGDKQAYAQYIDQLDQEIALGSWLFSLPSLAYFSTQFDDNTVDLYGTASQLSTIEKWQEKAGK